MYEMKIPGRLGLLGVIAATALAAVACSPGAAGPAASVPAGGSSQSASASSTAAPIPSLRDPLAGTWTTAKVTQSEWVKAFIAAGFSEKDAHQNFNGLGGGAEQYGQIILTFDNGRFTELQSGDGHEPVIGNKANYTVGTGGTFDLVTTGETFGYVVSGDTLQLHFVTADCSPNCGPPVGPTLYTSFPFTKVQ